MSFCKTCGCPVVRTAKHCRRHQQNGPRAKPLDERFWTSVLIASDADCWIWQKSKDRKGYGKFGTGSMKDGTRRIEIASRMAWIITHGEIEDGLFVCHRCDNPSCCNPSHLYLGTCADNLQEMHGKGRFRNKKWLSVDQVEKIKSLLDSRTNASISRELGISSSVVSRIRIGQSYKG